jgi:hypothetical protein
MEAGMDGWRERGREGIYLEFRERERCNEGPMGPICDREPTEP